MSAADVEFFWDPVCPFAWVTSRWMEKVARRRELDVDWRFISLAILNGERDYESEFPKGYSETHGRGLELLRVAAAAREAHGREAMFGLYTSFGDAIWTDEPDDRGVLGLVGKPGEIDPIRPLLERADLPTELAEEATDEKWNDVLAAETTDALSRTGDQVGTPIITYGPPDGPSLFGPVISRVPDDDEAVELWDAVTKLAHWDGFSELKRSNRELPQIPLITARS